MKHISPLVFLGILLAGGGAHAQQDDFSKVTIKTTKLTEGIYMLEGAGGNIGVSVGEDGVIVIDDQYAPLTEKIQEAISKLSPKPIKFVINTHWHGDHVGGNENLATAGSVIIAHENVRKRMSSEQFIQLLNRKVPPSPPRALPVVTFTTDITLHFNGEDIHVIHVDPTHTDGDSIIVFPKAKVVHMGDTYMTISYPYADLSSGGNFDGFLSTTDKVVGMTDATTKIIPGHGPLSNKAELKAWHDMLVEIPRRGEEAGRRRQVARCDQAGEADGQVGRQVGRQVHQGRPGRRVRVRRDHGQALIGVTDRGQVTRTRQ